MGQPVTFKKYMKDIFVRYIVALICLMLLIFIGFMTLHYQLFIVKANADCNEAIRADLAASWTAYSQGLDSLTQHPDIRQALRQPAELQAANQQLYEFSLGQTLQSDFVLLNREQKIIATNLYAGNQPVFRASRGIQDAILYLHSNPALTYSGVVHLPFDHGQKANFTFMKAVLDEGEISGYLAFSLKEDSFNTLLRQTVADNVVITDAFSNVIFATNSWLVDSLGKFNENTGAAATLIIRDKPHYLTAALVPDNNVRVITLTAVAKQQQLAQFGVFFLLSISAVLLLLMPFVVKRVTERSLRSMDELVHAVNECRDGNILYQITSQTFQELQMLYDNFNNMMLKVQQLLQSNTEMAERKRIMEVKQLEGQFNPHFVFNVMEALRYEILLNPSQASQLVVSFANLMRYSINYGSLQVPLATDIRYVEDYLRLQKMRYNQRLHYSIAIAEPLLRCQVPKLLLQPIVENSIVHGLEKTKTITITISGWQAADSLFLCVADNGPGLTADKYRELQLLLDDETADPAHIGLYNVHRVLQLLYGTDYGVTLAAADGGGLQVLLKIPLLEEERHV